MQVYALNYICGRAAQFGTLFLIAGGSVATAQVTPPPAVSVVSVMSRQVTETGSFVGRIVAIDKVDVVARVPDH